MSDSLKLQQLCSRILENPEESLQLLKELRCFMKEAKPYLIEYFKKNLIGIMYSFMIKSDSFKTEVKGELINVFAEVFRKLKVDNVTLYFNIMGLLLNEIYDAKENLVKNVNEEHKLLVVHCLIALNKSVSIDIILDIYNKAFTSKFTCVLYACIELAKVEKLRALRIAAMECIMTIARIDTDKYNSDTVLYNQIADMFMLFLPGLLTGLMKICMEDEKIGHKVIKTAVQSWGGLVNLMMKDYNPIDKKIDCDDINLLFNKITLKTPEENRNKFQNSDEIKEYINNSRRSRDWYKETDSKLIDHVNILQNLCDHSNWAVRSELADISLLLLENCTSTMPKSLSKIIVILITLSEDDNDQVSQKSKLGLDTLACKISSNYFKRVLDYLEEDFYNLLNSIPRTFNGLDNHKQLSSLNLLIGYIRLFGKYEFVNVLHSQIHLHKLIESLLYVCELGKTNTQLLDEWTIQDFDTNPDLRTPWKRFEHFASNDLVLKLKQLCELLAQDIIMNIVVDCLLDVYINDSDKQKEAAVLLNEIVSVKSDNNNIDMIKTVIDVYLEPSHWNLSVTVSMTDGENKINLAKVENNIILLCLQLEGIGKIALLLQEKFKDFLLRTLYPVMEKAGSGQPLLKAAGLATITNISIACNYKSVTDLINNNSDYFSYHVTRKLRCLNKNEHVLNVLGVVLNHCSMDVLPSIADIVEDILYQSRTCTTENTAAFMRVFSIFTKSLLRWLNIKVVLQPVKSKCEKEQELRNFEVSNLEAECNDFSDEVLGKTAEEMYEEDVKKKKEELEEESYPEFEEIKKPEPPQHIKLTVSILRRTLHFLPSKTKEVKILSLEILKNGLEVIRDWEDELLPIVHEIWSPLVNRFKDDSEHLIFNLSFQLLTTLARLSKEFIRSRTVKEVLPSILNVMQKLSRESYLKDRGSAYRYTQAYKLQMIILEQLARLVIDLDISGEEMMNCMEAVKVYLSDKQPLPLRNNCLEFYKTLAIYDPDTVKTFIDGLKKLDKYEKTRQYLLDTLKEI